MKASLTPPFTLPFTKMHGIGNDFVVIDQPGIHPDRQFSESLNSALARKICDRRFGIGADQILWLRAPEDSSQDVRMEIFNADGSIAEMCGNGIRAVAVYLQKYLKGRTSPFRVETLAGNKEVRIQGDQVSVDMGCARLGAGFSQEGELLEIQGNRLRFFEVNVGNPHAVIFVKDVDQFPVAEIGPKIENHFRFPERTNVEFVEILGADFQKNGPSDFPSVKLRVWERGAGITLACGTGACAAAVACLVTERVEPWKEGSGGRVEVRLPGGILKIQWKGLSHPVMMEGPAQEVFQGTFFVAEV